MNERIQLTFESEAHDGGAAKHAGAAKAGVVSPPSDAAPGDAKAKAAGLKLRNSPFSHKLYDYLGLRPSLRGVNIFIGIIVVLLIVAIIIGIAT